jgi:hypothetical protein
MLLRSTQSFETLHVTVTLESPVMRADSWAVCIKRGGETLQTWLEATELAACAKYGEVETTLRVLEALEERKRSSH